MDNEPIIVAKNFNSTYWLNTASASKVGKVKPFLGGSKKTKRSADGYFCFQIQ